MIPQHIWDEIESSLFAATLGVVSTPRAFDAALLHQSTIITLMAHLSASSDVADVVRRLNQLHSEPTDTQYCHQHDLAIGVYLRVLDICAPEAAAGPAKSALGIPNLWWGMAMAKRIAATPNRAIPFSRIDFEVPVSGTFTRQSQINKVQYVLPPSVHSARSQLPGTVTASTNAGYRSNELAVLTTRVSHISSGDIP